jgi:hypothetical protein
MHLLDLCQSDTRLEEANNWIGIAKLSRVSVLWMRGPATPRTRWEEALKTEMTGFHLRVYIPDKASTMDNVGDNRCINTTQDARGHRI